MAHPRSSIQRLALALLCAASLTVAAVSTTDTAEANERLKGKTFHFGTHPARTNISFVSDADLETIHGTTNTMSGSIQVDAAGTSATGTLVVPVKALKTGIDLRDEHLRSDKWLDAARFPSITLKVVEAKEGTDGRTWTVKAQLTVKGVTREVTTKARVIAFSPQQTTGLGQGEWVRVRAKFDVKLSDHGVTVPASVGAKVSDVWALSIDLYGTTVKPQPRR